MFVLNVLFGQQDIYENYYLLLSGKKTTHYLLFRLYWVRREEKFKFWKILKCIFYNSSFSSLSLKCEHLNDGIHSQLKIASFN